MANHSQFRWPAQPPPGSNAGDLNPTQSFISAVPSGPRSVQGFQRPIYNGAPYLQPTHPNSSTDLYFANTRTPGPFVSPGHGAQRSVQPPSGPGYRSSGGSPRPGNFFAMRHSYGTPAPPIQVPPQALAQFSGAGPQGMFQMLQQSAPSRQGQAQVKGIPGSMPPASLNQSGAIPRSLLSSWLGDPVQKRSPLQLQGEMVTVEGKRGSDDNRKETDLKVIVANIKDLVNQAEKSISEILDVVKLQRPIPGAALGVCQVDPRHGVPAAALFRHSLKCPTSASGPLELDSLLQYLQYPQTAPRDSFRSGLFEDRGSKDHTGTEYHGDFVNLANKEPSLYSSIGASSTTPSCPIVKQEMCALNNPKSSIYSAGLTDPLSVRIEGTRSTDAPKASSHTAQEFDSSGRLFFYRDAPGVFITPSSSPIEVFDSFTLSLLPPFLRVEVASESKMAKHYGGRADIRAKTNSLTTSVDGNGGKKIDQREDKGGHSGAAKGVFSKKDGASVSTMAQSRSLSKISMKESINIFDAQHLQLLPSMLWLLERETEAWKDLPTRWPRLVLEAAAGSGRVSKRLVVPWLLVHSPSYGVVLDVAMASHMYSLVKLFLKAVSTEALRFLQEFHTEKHQPFQRGLEITTDGIPAGKASNETSFSGRYWKDQVDCMVVAEGGSWLAAKLAQLYEPARSRAFVLDLLKFCLKSSGNGVTVFSLDPLLEWSKSTNTLEPRCQGGEGKGDAGGSWKALLTQDRGPVGSAWDLSPFEDTRFHLVETEKLETVEVRQVEAALDALSERASFGRYINSRIRLHNFTKFQIPMQLLVIREDGLVTYRIADYEAVVKRAEEVRARRPNFRPVSDHDGLTWQRSQQQEKKNKTKAELLAEERDYKRRRMSYRGKKLKRSSTEVLHDIIDGHMAEIAEAGGIGCFAKLPLDAPLQQLRIENAPLFGSKSELITEYSRTSNPLLSDSQQQSGSASQDIKPSVYGAGYLGVPLDVRKVEYSRGFGP